MVFRKTKRRSAFFLVAGLSVFNMASAGTSPVAEFSWDYRSFCNITIPSYMDAYSDGEKELVLASLHRSQSFRELTDIQKSAFLRLVDYFHESYGNVDGGKKQAQRECVSTLDQALNSIAIDDHVFCSDVSMRVGEAISQSTPNREGADVKKIAYQKCMLQRTGTQKNGNYR